MPEIKLFFMSEEDAQSFLTRFKADGEFRNTVGALTADDGKWEIHQPSGLAEIRARRLPTVLTQMSGVTEILEAITDRWDDGDQWGSATETMFALCYALYSLGESIPPEYQFSPGAWNGMFSADDFRSGGPGGDYEFTVEILQQMDAERGVTQIREVMAVLDPYREELRAAGHSY